MIFVHTMNGTYMVENVRWEKSDSSWTPIFICIDRDGEKHDVNPSKYGCAFVLDKEAEILNIAFITVGDLPVDHRFVTEKDESNADHLETLNRDRDIREALEYVLDQTVPDRSHL